MQAMPYEAQHLTIQEARNPTVRNGAHRQTVVNEGD